jgi:hypothetical protein
MFLTGSHRVSRNGPLVVNLTGKVDDTLFGEHDYFNPTKFHLWIQVVCVFAIPFARYTSRMSIFKWKQSLNFRFLELMTDNEVHLIFKWFNK